MCHDHTASNSTVICTDIILLDFILQDGVTALMVAIHHGSSGVTEVLLGAKADVNIITKV